MWDTSVIQLYGLIAQVLFLLTAPAMNFAPQVEYRGRRQTRLPAFRTSATPHDTSCRRRATESKAMLSLLLAGFVLLMPSFGRDLGAAAQSSSLPGSSLLQRFDLPSGKYGGKLLP